MNSLIPQGGTALGLLMQLHNFQLQTVLHHFIKLGFYYYVTLTLLLHFCYDEKVFLLQQQKKS